MMGVVVHHPDAVRLALGFKPALGPAEFLQGSQDVRQFEAQFPGGGNGPQGIEYIVPAGDDQMALADGLSLVHHIEMGAVGAVDDVLRLVIRILLSMP